MKRNGLILVLIIAAVCSFYWYNTGGEIVKGSEIVSSNSENGKVEDKSTKDNENSSSNMLETDTTNQGSKQGTYTICIDPGHQEKGNDDREPMSPSSDVTQIKVSKGTKGLYTGKLEYALNLEISLKLKQKLLDKGYKVVMTRESHNVNISNKERAEIANSVNADFFILIHADAFYEDTSIQGAYMIVPSRESAGTEEIFLKSKRAAEIITELLKENNIKTRYIAYRSELSALNWSKVPVVLIETGFMTNREDDYRLSDFKYQEKLADILVESIESFLKEYSE